MEWLAVLNRDMIQLIGDLPSSHQALLALLSIHWSNVIKNVNNKVSLNQLVATLEPSLHCSKKLIGVFIQYHHELFGYTTIAKYHRPLRWTGHIEPETFIQNLPNKSKEFIVDEIARQSWVQNRIHIQLKHGWEDHIRRGRLWEVQRILTTLGRELKDIEKRELTKLQAEQESELRVILEEQKLILIKQEELLRVQDGLKSRIKTEKRAIEDKKRLKLEGELARGDGTVDHQDLDADLCGLNEDELLKMFDYFYKENAVLENKNSELVTEIDRERALLLEKRIQYRMAVYENKV